MFVIGPTGEPQPVLAPAGVDHPPDSVAPPSWPDGRELRTRQAALPVHVGAACRAASSGGSAPEWTGISTPIRSRAMSGAARGPLERRVAADRGDPKQGGVSGGDHERHGVVMARVAVEDDRGTVARSVMGSPGDERAGS